MVSKGFKSAFEQKKVSKEQLQEISKLLQILEAPVVDVEWAIHTDFQKLYTSLVEKSSNEVAPKSKNLKQ